MTKIGTLTKRPILKQFIVVKSHHARNVRNAGLSNILKHKRADSARHGIDGESSDEERDEGGTSDERCSVTGRSE